MDGDIGSEIANLSLNIGAIKLNPENPFEWASGYRMPIYNDNRMFLFNSSHRRMIMRGFENLYTEINLNNSIDVIAGTSTAGISPGTTLADHLRLPFIYVRDKPKSHGLKNQIEGIDADSDLSGKNVLLIEDLISTGGSSAKAVQAIRDANGKCNYCFSIFDYGLRDAVDAFASLDPKCEVMSLLNYDTLMNVAKVNGHINYDQLNMLIEWRTDPFGWGEKRGFHRVEKQ